MNPWTNSGVDDLPPVRSGVVHVLFCAGHGYFQHLAVAAISLASNSHCTHVSVHVITTDKDPVADAMLRETLQPFPHVSIDITHVEDSRLDCVFLDRHLTKETYLRFLAPDVLPPEVTRVLYLDCDLLVLDDVALLYNIPLNGKAVGAVPDVDWKMGRPTRFNALGINPGHIYVNAGVLLIDLDRWRRSHIANQLFDFAMERGPVLEYHDQDALNAVLQGDILQLDRRWNVPALMYGRWIRSAAPGDYSATVSARRAPGIIHFTTATKPWNFRSPARRKELYFHYLRRTTWRSARPAGLSAAQCVEYNLSCSLLRLGINIYAGAGIVRRTLAMASAIAVRTRGMVLARARQAP